MLIAIALAYATCMALSLAINRHFQNVWPGKKLSTGGAILLRNSGWLLLILTLVYCANLEGAAVGLILALGLFGAIACLVALLLHYAPRTALGLVIAAPLASLL